MKVEDLRQYNDESYDKWFERWYEKENLEAKLKESAMKGFEAYRYNLDVSYSDYLKRRMSNGRFLTKLEEKLPDFNIYRIEPYMRNLEFLGRKYGTSWTDLQIIISWEKLNLSKEKME